MTKHMQDVLEKAVDLPPMMNSKLIVSVAAGINIGMLSASAEERPNVILIMVDDLGWSDTGVYGSTFYKTPNLDALARQGMLFTDAYAANSRCSPTRASVLTGQYPMRTGLTGAGGHAEAIWTHQERTRTRPEIRGVGPAALNYLDPKHYTMAKAMKDAGYATSFFGKWHMGRRPEVYPENHGFDFVKGGRWHSGPPGANPGRKFFPPWDDCAMETLDSNIPEDTHIDDYLTELAIDYMKEHRESPFFMCFWPYSVHAPYQSKPELIEKWRKKVDPNDPQRSPTMAAMIEVMDTAIGNLLQGIKELGLEENTLVIFTSDNGGNMYDTVDGTTPTNNLPLRLGKGNSYEGGVRVPLIVRYPGLVKPGSVNHSVVSSVDYYPTILQLAGLPLRPDDHKDGVSFVPALRGDQFDRGPTLCDEPDYIPATHNIPNTSIRIGEWKMYRYWFGNPDQTHRHELYNLGKDIGERTNLAEEYPERIEEMSQVLDAYYEKSGVLTYHPNENYNHRAVGAWWALSDDGVIAERNGGLFFQSEKPGYAVQTRSSPSLRGNCGGRFAFRGRSSSRAAVKLQWLTNTRGEFDDDQSLEFSLKNNWQDFDIPFGEIRGHLADLKLILTEPGDVELRDVRILTADGTEIMNYPFF